MKVGKPPKLTKKTKVSLVRSSAAEYLTFVAASGQGGVEAMYADESIWITQKMMGVLYDVNVRTVEYGAGFTPHLHAVAPVMGRHPCRPLSR